MKVKDLLEPELVTVGPLDSISEAWHIIKSAGATGAVVVTEEGRIVGFITDGDLIRTCMPSSTDITIYDEIMTDKKLPNTYIKQLRKMRVEHAMQSEEEVITIDKDEPALIALALMEQHRLRRIPVLDGNKLIGTISRGQILSHILYEQDLREE